MSETSGQAVRRWVVVLTPLLAGLFLVVGAVADPAPGLQGRELAQAYADAPDRVQFKSVGYHFAFGFLGAMVFLLAGRIRGRGVWLANLAVLLAFLGITTLPGFILADFYDSAIGQTVGLDGYDQIDSRLEGMWGLALLAGTGGAGLFLSVAVIAAAVWRARLLPWWGALLPVLGPAAFMLSADEVGATIAAAILTVFTIVLYRADWTHEPPAT